MSDPREALVALIQDHILDEGANECSCEEWEHWEDPYPERIATYSGHVADAILAAGWTPPEERTLPSVEDMARALWELAEQEAEATGGALDLPWSALDSLTQGTYQADAEDLLALLPGRTQASRRELKGSEVRAAQFITDPDEIRAEVEADRG